MHPPTPDDLPEQPAIGAMRAAIPADGILIATRTDRQAGPPAPASDRPDVFLLYRLTQAGVVEVAREESTTVQALAWLDHHTLLVYRETDAMEGSLTRIVDGVPQAPLPIPRASWNLAAAPETAPARLVIANHGEIWLERCATRDPDATCTRSVALRVDVSPFAHATAAPPANPGVRVDQPRSGGHLLHATLPSVMPPSGHAIALFAVPPAQRQNGLVTYDKGFACTSPRGKVAWPGDTDWIERQNVPMYRPSSVRWVSVTPPAYVVEGTATNMVGKTRAMASLFHACETDPALDAVYLGGDLWAELDPPIGPGPGHGDDPPYVHSTWQVRAADHPIAKLVGSETWFAPQPR